MNEAPALSLPSVPLSELQRSAAARSIGWLAQESGLFCANFEHRLALPLPEWWQVPDADLGPYPWEAEGGWRAGGLQETKFRTFRLDRRIGSFHPAHGAKWGAHELCHGLVGFGWRPDAGPLWTATAARLAELLPVALWYFFDEAGLERCPRHAGQGALFGASCPDCEAHAAAQPGALDGPDVALWQRRGKQFVEAEIDAAWRTLRSGVPVSSRHGTIDLCTDGLAYARAHGPVLSDPVFAEWVEQFCSVDRGWHADLDSLISRVRDVVGAICGARDAPALNGHAGTWMAQDLGWRLCQLRAEVDGELDRELASLVTALAEASAEDDAACMARVDAVMASYEALFDDYVVPSPVDLFAVGYPLPRGYGRSRSQLVDGLRETLPLTCAMLTDELEAVVEVWMRSEALVRQGIGDRFAAWARQHLDPAIADQASLEAALVHVPPPDLAATTLGLQAAREARWHPARNSRFVRIEHDVGTDPAHPGSGAPLDAPIGICVLRGLDGAREVMAVEVDAFSRTPLSTDALTPQDAALIEAGMLVPDRWQASAETAE